MKHTSRTTPFARILVVASFALATAVGLGATAPAAAQTLPSGGTQMHDCVLSQPEDGTKKVVCDASWTLMIALVEGRYNALAFASTNLVFPTRKDCDNAGSAATIGGRLKTTLVAVWVCVPAPGTSHS